jgi:hypothetical protein
MDFFFFIFFFFTVQHTNTMWRLVEQPIYQMTEGLAATRYGQILLVNDGFKDIHLVRASHKEWMIASHHFINEHNQGLSIRCFIMAFTCDDFRSDIIGSATCCVDIVMYFEVRTWWIQNQRGLGMFQERQVVVQHFISGNFFDDLSGTVSDRLEVLHCRLPWTHPKIQ